MPNEPTLTFDQLPAYLRVQVEGAPPTAQAGVEFWTTIADECRKRDQDNVMVVEVLEPMQTFHGVFGTASQLPDLFVGIKLAFVFVGDDARNYQKFGEDVAINRGADIRVFRDERDAVQWLVSS